jgi:hypothetical protein
LDKALCVAAAAMPDGRTSAGQEQEFAGIRGLEADFPRMSLMGGKRTFVADQREAAVHPAHRPSRQIFRAKYKLPRAGPQNKANNSSILAQRNVSSPPHTDAKPKTENRLMVHSPPSLRHLVIHEDADAAMGGKRTSSYRQ